jgi:hypothetical protein
MFGKEDWERGLLINLSGSSIVWPGTCWEVMETNKEIKNL